MMRKHHRIFLPYPRSAECVVRESDTNRHRYRTAHAETPFCAYISRDGFEKSERSSGKRVDVFPGIVDGIKKLKTPTVHRLTWCVRKTARVLYTRFCRRVCGFGTRSGRMGGEGRMTGTSTFY